MKKISFIGTILLAIFVTESVCGAAPWRTIQRAEPLFGTPIKVEAVITTGEFLKKGKAPDEEDAYHYAYKFIVRRPSGDHGQGIASYTGILGYEIPFRLHYWAAEEKIDPFLALPLYSDKKVYQYKHPDRRKVIVYLQQGLKPGEHKICITVFPYQMWRGYSLRDIIRLYRSEYTSFLQGLITAIRTASPWWGFAKIVSDYAVDATAEELLENIAYDYGEIGILEVLAKMPDIHMKKERRIVKMLKRRSLVPRPGPTIATNDRSLHGKVAKHRFYPGDRLKAGTHVPYKVYKFEKPKKKIKKKKKNGYIEDGIWR